MIPALRATAYMGEDPASWGMGRGISCISLLALIQSQCWAHDTHLLPTLVAAQISALMIPALLPALMPPVRISALMLSALMVPALLPARISHRAAVAASGEKMVELMRETAIAALAVLSRGSAVTAVVLSRRECISRGCISRGYISRGRAGGERTKGEGGAPRLGALRSFSCA